MGKVFMEKPVSRTVPVILAVTKEMLLEAINLARQKEHLDPIHIGSCTVEVTVPSGGDYSGMEIDVGTRDTPINIRWQGEM